MSSRPIDSAKITSAVKVDPVAKALSYAIGFAGLASDGYDLWAASLLHITVLGCLTVLVIRDFMPGTPTGLFGDLLLLLGAFLLVVSLSFVGSINPSESRVTLLDMVTASVFFLALNVFRTDDSLRQLSAGLVFEQISRVTGKTGQSYARRSAA